MKFAWAVVLTLCASALMQIEVKGQVSEQQVQQLFKTVGSFLRISPSGIGKILKNAEGRSFEKLPDVLTFLKENGVGSAEIEVLSSVARNILSSRNSPDGVVKATHFMKMLNTPQSVVGKFKQLAPPKIPTARDEISTLLDAAGLKQEQKDMACQSQVPLRFRPRKVILSFPSR